MVRDTEGIKFLTNCVLMAITDEWFAHYQYWIGSVIVGNRYGHVVEQFREHSIDEYDHATELALWLRDFPRTGALPRAMSELPKYQHCGYVYPSGNTVSALVLDAIEGERCAIDFYDSFIVDLEREGLEYYADLENANYHRDNLLDIIERILAKEKEHLRDLERLFVEIF